MSALRSLIVWCAIVRLAAPTPFQRRGNHSIGSIAPYWNLTTITTSSAVAVPISTPESVIVTPTSTKESLYSSSSSSSGTAYYSSSGTAPYSIPQTSTGYGTGITSQYGFPTPTGQVSTNSSIARNRTDPLCTVNVPQANVDWWYAATYGYAVGRLVRTDGNFTEVYRTFIPNTETFDISSAISSDVAWTESLTYDAEWDMTWTYYDSYTVTPSASTTSVITRTDYLPLPSDGLVPERNMTLYDITDYPPATVAVTAAANKTVYVATSATPLVYFSVYEVESAAPVTGADGRVTTTTLTETFHLPQPYAGSYFIKGIEDLATVTGGYVPDDFIQQIPQSTCEPGVVHGTVTVVVVLDEYYVHVPHTNPFIVHIESSAIGFGDPDPTDDPVVVQDTRRNTGKARTSAAPNTQNVPIIQPTADGFTTPSAIIKPGVKQSDVPTTPRINNPGNNDPGVQQSNVPTTPQDNNPGNNNPGQGTPNVPVQTSRTVGTIGTNPVVIGPSSVVVVGSQTVTPGAPPVTVGGAPISVVPAGTAIVVGTRTSNLPQVFVPPANNQANPPPVITVGASTLTPNAATQFFVAPGTTLTPGGTAIIGGTFVSLAPSASFIVVGGFGGVGGSTQFFPAAAPTFAPTPTIVIGGSTFTANQNGNFVVGSQTLTPGQQIVVDGSTVSLAPSGQNFVVVNGATTVLASSPSPVVNVGGSAFTASVSGGTTAFIFAPGQTLAPGGILTLSGTTLSMPASGSGSIIVVNGVTSTLANRPPSPTVNIGGSAFTASVNGGTTAFVFAPGETLTPGGILTVSGTTLSMPASGSGSVIVVNGVTSTLANNPSSPTVNVGGSVFTASVNGGTTAFVFGPGQTLTPGGVLTISGTTLSMPASGSGSVVVVNGVTSTLANPAAQITPPPLTIGSEVFTATSGSYVIDGQTLTPGGVITVDGSTISLAPGATALIINGQTTLLNPTGPITNAPLLTVGSETFSAISGTTYVIHGQTLTPGGTIVFDGTTISLAPGATELYITSSGRTSSTALFPATTTRSRPITTATAASAGATGDEKAPAETSSKGAGSTIAIQSGFESWVLSIVVAFVSVMFN